MSDWEFNDWCVFVMALPFIVVVAAIAMPILAIGLPTWLIAGRLGRQRAQERVFWGIGLVFAALIVAASGLAYLQDPLAFFTGLWSWPTAFGQPR